MRVEEFMNSEVYEYLISEDNDIGLDYKDLESFIKDKEEIYLATGIAEGEHNVELAVEIAIKNLEEVWGNINFDRFLLMIEGDLLMNNVCNGINILREKLQNDTDILFGAKYIANSEKKAIVDIVLA